MERMTMHDSLFALLTYYSRRRHKVGMKVNDIIELLVHQTLLLIKLTELKDFVTCLTEDLMDGKFFFEER